MIETNETPNPESLEPSSFEVLEPKGSRVLTFFINYKWHLVIALGAIALITGGFYGYRIYQQGRENKASLALSRVRDLYDKGDYPKAVAGDPNLTIRGESVIGLAEIVEKYGSTNAGKSAALLCGNAEMKMGKYDDAISSFEKAGSSDAEIVEVGAQAGIGAALELKNDLKSAIEHYEKAAKLAEKTGGEERYIFYSAFCYEKLGDKDKAIEKYKEILSKSEINDYTGYAKAGMTRLGQSIEF